MRIITKIQPQIPKLPEKRRVAAYARVSRNYERLENSLSAQVSYYNKFIQCNPKWEYVQIYVDDAKNGGNVTTRDGFNKMIADCEKGLIDIILTKSISRFARNTVDLLKTVRHLKSLGIEVRFEREKINSLSEEGEFLLTLLASFAQEESRSCSENIQWAFRTRYAKGISLNYNAYGHKRDGDGIAIVEEEAIVIRRMFSEFIAGKTLKQIADGLNNDNITKRGSPFIPATVRSIITNIRYTGNMLLQKTYSADYMTRKRKINNGEYPKYYIENHHKPIVDMATFEAAKKELKKRNSIGYCRDAESRNHYFSDKIYCEICGNFYSRSRKTENFIYWKCAINRCHGPKGCPCISVNEKKLERLCALVLDLEVFDKDIFNKNIKSITADGKGSFSFRFFNGKEIIQDLKQLPKE